MHKWTEEEKNFLREYYTNHSRQETYERFVAKFGCADLTKEAMVAMIKKMGLNNIFTTTFEKGHVPWQKGRPLTPEQRKKLEPTMFKKGHKTHNHLPVGTIAKPGGTFWRIKVAEPDKWEPLHHHIYEKVYGPIPEGSVVGFADGDENNLMPENLYCTTKRISGVMNLKLGPRAKTKEQIEVDIAIAKLMGEIYEKHNSTRT